MFLRKELPVRLANTMKEVNLLPDKLLGQPSVRLVQKWSDSSQQMKFSSFFFLYKYINIYIYLCWVSRRYMQSFVELLDYENRNPEDAHTLNE